MCWEQVNITILVSSAVVVNGSMHLMVYKRDLQVNILQIDPFVHHFCEKFEGKFDMTSFALEKGLSEKY